MLRSVKPELLDSLAPNDPRAQRSRRDLIRINVIMGQERMMAAMLRDLPPPAMLVDLGSGDGNFLLGVARRLAGSGWRGVRAVIADRQNIVSEETRRGFAAIGWECEVKQGDIFVTLDSLPPPPSLAREPATGHSPSSALRARGGVYVTANLFLHHFKDSDLARLLGLAAAKAQALIACEPQRSVAAFIASHLVALIGANAVTRHDAAASVRAGFAGHDLTRLWPAQGQWHLHETARFPFSHRFAAIREGGSPTSDDPLPSAQGSIYEI